MKTVPMTEELYEYVVQHAPYSHPIQHKINCETKDMPMSQMQIAKDQGALISTLVRLMQAKYAVELGCFTGYSAISIASALPADGQLFSIDIDAEMIARAKGYAQEAGLADRVTYIVQDGKTALENLLETRGPASIDLAFLDADKEGMWTYFELCCDLVRPNGLIIADNVIWGGSVIDKTDERSSTAAIRMFNSKVKDDPRVEGCMLHISDGLYLLRRL